MNYFAATTQPQDTDCDLLVLLVRATDPSAPTGHARALADALAIDPFEVAGEEGFEGKASQSCLLRAPAGIAARRLLLVGAGGGERAEVREAAQRAGKRATEARAASVVIALPEGASVEAAVEGFARGAYRFTTYKTQAEDAFAGVERVGVLGAGEDEIARARALAAGVEAARVLVNEPPQSLTPPALADRAVEIARGHGLEHRVWLDDELEAQGFNLIMAVGKGSDAKPRLVHLTYSPEGEVRHRVAFVGKGVTFDTGGYNIKTGGSMLHMHTDMAGAAAVLGAARAIGEIAPAGVEVHFIVPTVENSVSGGAMRPNDIYRGYGDQTVEIGNTDAEGRLILADALAYAQEQQVDTIVDLATLTGASIVALGERTSAIFTNAEELWGEIERAIEGSNEDYWRMPLHPKLDAKLDSKVADMKNIGGRPGGAITAALFLKRWVELERWAHMDIAGPSFTESGDDHLAAGGTGFGVTTLVALAELLGKN